MEKREGHEIHVNRPGNSPLIFTKHGTEIEVWKEIGERMVMSLAAGNPPAHDPFSRENDTFRENLSYHQRVWVDKGLEIGAISRPAARLFFRNTPLLLEHLKAYHLITWGDWALQLLRTGGENESTAISFLDSSPGLIQFMPFYELKKWFAAGDHLFRQAADIGPSYFSSLPEEFSRLYMTERLSVYDLIIELAGNDPKKAFSLYQSSPKMLGRLNSIVRTQLLEIMNRAASEQPERLVGFFDLVMEVFPSLEYPAQECILKCEKRIRGFSLEASMSYLMKTRDLLKEIPYYFVPYFVERGIPVLNRSERHGRGYFGLETDESRREISRWKQAIMLDDHRDVLGYLACALTDREIEIRKMEEEPGHRYHRAGAYPAGDGRNIYLQPYAAGGETPRENFQWYKAAVAHQAGYMEWGIFQDPSFLEKADFESFSLKDLAVDVFFILEDGRIDCLLRQEYRGLAQDLDRVLAAKLGERPEPSDLPLQEAMVEILLRLTCGFLSGWKTGERVKEHVHFLEQELSGFYKSRPGLWDVYRKTQKIYDYLSRLPQSEAYRPIIPLILIARGRTELELPNGRGPRPTLPAGVAFDSKEEESGFQKSNRDKSRFYENNRIPILRFMDDEEDLPSQGLFGRDADQMKADPPQDKTEESDYPREKAGFYFPGLREKQQTGPFYYDEWDYQTRTYRPRWCHLYEEDIRPVNSEVVRAVYQNSQDLIQKVRRQFQRIRPESLEMVRGVEWGQEFYQPALIQSVVERKAGVSPTDRIFARREKKLRKISILFLVDMSASTAEPVPCRDMDLRQEKRIIDIEVESLVVIMEALDAFSDEYAIYGFSGYGREQVDFYRIKNFSDPYSETLKQRIGGIEPKKSTRMGPAIRHAVQKMREIDSDQRLLILLSDGFPQDSDYGEDRSSKEYGLQDTMMALLEAGRERVRPFCITVDQAGNDYLKRICDPASYLVIKDIYGLPETMPKIIASLII